MNGKANVENVGMTLEQFMRFLIQNNREFELDASAQKTVNYQESLEVVFL